MWNEINKEQINMYFNSLTTYYMHICIFLLNTKQTYELWAELKKNRKKKLITIFVPNFLMGGFSHIVIPARPSELSH